MGVTATRSSTTEPMLVGDAFTSSCGAARGARNLISRDLSACRSRRGDWASSPDVELSAVWLSESASNEGGVEFSSLWPLTRHGTWPIVIVGGLLVPAPHDHERRRALRRHRERLARPPGAAHAQGLRAEARRRAPGSGPRDGSPDELDDAGSTGAELPRPGARRRPVPADVLRRAAPRRDAGASPAAAEFHRALLRAGAADGSRVI